MSWMDDWTGTTSLPQLPALCLIPSNDPVEPSGQLLTRRAELRRRMQPTWDAICRNLAPARGAVRTTP